MSCHPSIAADTGGMAGWVLFTNHMHILTALAQRPDLRLREIASEVGITERATHRIVSELVNDGYLTRERIGARNRYEIDETLGGAPSIFTSTTTLGRSMRMLGTSKEQSSTEQRAGQDETMPLTAGSAETLRVFVRASAGRDGARRRDRALTRREPCLFTACWDTRKTSS